MIQAEVRQLISNHEGDCKGEERDIVVLLPPLWNFPQPESSDFPFCFFSGDGDMAVSNTMRSNAYDILLCLGITWLIKTAAWNAPIEISK